MAEAVHQVVMQGEQIAEAMAALEPAVEQVTLVASTPMASVERVAQQLMRQQEAVEALDSGELSSFKKAAFSLFKTVRIFSVTQRRLE